MVCRLGQLGVQFLAHPGPVMPLLVVSFTALSVGEGICFVWIPVQQAAEVYCLQSWRRRVPTYTMEANDTYMYTCRWIATLTFN